MEASDQIRVHVDGLKVQIESLTRPHDFVIQKNALANALCNSWWTEHDESLDGLVEWLADHVELLEQHLASGAIGRKPTK